MYLGAYIHINNLDKIAKENGIDIPKMRGCRLMKNEKPVSNDEIKAIKKRCAIHIVEELCTSKPFWTINPSWHRYDEYTA